MCKKLFVVADIHGHYTILRQALDELGFDENNENHVFISCGDLFDRGNENLSVYKFVKGLKHKVLIRGNHEDMLYSALESGNLTSTDNDNGTKLTVSELLGEDAVNPDGSFDTALHAEKISEIKAFIDSMQNHLEVGNYVFTHGWLPVLFEGYYPKIPENWRDASKEDWELAHIFEWQQFYSVKAVLEGKTIVCGHRPSYLAHVFDSSREPDCTAPFYGDGIIAIDAGTYKSGRMNVIVIEL